MSHFSTAYERTLGHEGGYSNDTRDAGGETYKGIARVYNPKWAGWAVIDSIKLENPASFKTKLDSHAALQDAVKAFYLVNFANPLKLSSFDIEIACELFDTAVNQGLITAGKYLQSALNLLNQNGSLYKDIDTDGKIGSDTIEAYEAYMQTQRLPGRSAERNVRALLKVLNGLQLERYMEICRANPSQEVWLYGWLNRV